MSRTTRIARYQGIQPKRLELGTASKGTRDYLLEYCVRYLRSDLRPEAASPPRDGMILDFDRDKS